MSFASALGLMEAAAACLAAEEALSRGDTEAAAQLADRARALLLANPKGRSFRLLGTLELVIRRLESNSGKAAGRGE